MIQALNIAKSVFNKSPIVMNSIRFSFAFLFAALIVVTTSHKTALAQATNSQPEVTESPLTIGSTFQFKSQIMQGDRQINVWLPPSYAEGDTKYDVLYVIDGGSEQDFHHISGLAQLATINASFDELIVVGITTNDRVAELCSEQKDPRYIKLSPTLGNSDRFLKHISEEVIPFIEKKYRTGERRAVIGESLAGLFVAEVFLTSPGTFTDYVSISPSMWWDDQALAKSAEQSLKAHDNQPRQIYFTIGDEGGTMRAGLDTVMKAIDKNKPEGLTMHFVDRQDSAAHSTIYHPAAHDALLKLFGKPLPDYGESPWYLIEGGQPEDDDK